MARFDIHNKWQWHELAWQARYNARTLSRNLQISSRQLRRYTEKIFGTSPQQWLNDHRMQFAAGLLVKHRSAKHAAIELGFKQLAHFSREFKLYYGVSAREFLLWSDRQRRRTEPNAGLYTRLSHSAKMSAADNSCPNLVTTAS